MSYIEFLEAIARVADKLNLVPNEIKTKTGS